MAAKMIRDGLLDSERVQKRSVEARWLFVAILLQADDVGLFEVSHFKLHRAAALDEKRIPALLAELESADLIRPYKVGSKTLAFVPRYGQRLQIKRAKHPLPPAELMVDDDDAINKIKQLAENPPCATVANGKAPPEPEPEPEPKRSVAKVQSVAPAAGAPATAKGQRLPIDWVLPKTWGEWALADRAGWTADTVRLEAAKFADHWHAKSGKDATKVDWQATWRNWCRNARSGPPARAALVADTAARNAEARRLLGFETN